MAARTEARIKTDIWRDGHFLALDPMAKLVYLTILSQPKLGLCGVISYTPGAWASSIGITRQAVHDAVIELEESHEFVVLNEPTEELWVRTLTKNDGVLTKPYMIIAMSKDFGSIQSDTIRGRFLDQLGPRFVPSLPERFPKAFDGTKSLAAPFLDAFNDWFGK